MHTQGFRGSVAAHAPFQVRERIGFQDLQSRSGLQTGSGKADAAVDRGSGEPFPFEISRKLISVAGCELRQQEIATETVNQIPFDVAIDCPGSFSVHRSAVG